jgi:hypothetical protein
MQDLLQSLTPEFFNTVIVVIIVIGVALAAVRLYADFTRPLPPEAPHEDETADPRDDSHD